MGGVPIHILPGESAMYPSLRPFSILVLILSALLVPRPAAAQSAQADTLRTVRILLVDGSSQTGTLVEESASEVTIRSAAGITMRIPRERIRELIDVTGSRFVRLDPNISRLLFAPTARAVPKREGYIADYWLFFPFVAYGAGGGVTLAGGMTLIPGISSQLVYLAPKWSIVDGPRSGLAVGVLAVTAVGNVSDWDIGFAGLLYGVGSIGSPTSSASLGLAFGYSDGDVSGKPVFMLGGEHQISNSTKLITENWWVAGIEDALIISAGIRFFGDKVAVDLAFITVPELIKEGGWPAVPWLGFAYNFGRG